MNTKDLIIEKSFVLFLKKGLKEASLNDILSTCGVSKGAFYHYYKSKDELIVEVLNRFFFSYFKKQDVDYSNVSFDDKITFLINAFIEPYNEIAVVLGEKHISAYFRFLFQVINLYPNIRYRVNKHFYTKGYYIYQIIEQAKINGEIKAEVNSKVVARQILSTIIGVLVLEGIYDISKIKNRFEQIIGSYLNLLMN